MKKAIIYILLVLAGLLVGGAVWYYMPYRGDSLFNIEQTETVIDSSAVKQIAMEVINPSFETAEEVLDYQRERISAFSDDSTFRCMNSGTLLDVATVILSQAYSTKVHNIVYEYENHRAVYDNLPPPVTVEVHDTVYITQQSDSV